ncbi:hypothetical protein DL766_010417 [Monosporascus sp. MC13-8B]|uniref:Uncharacterized protein n=1 Tax=Monosporascus cannonballus TaxID=155416 RepID=A0ABY0HI23_9PEZI|nr:hypothetical protein DL763_004535 [Monosporascus cannonballus]RYO93902.1 hypothetical protein DL762_000857 [Monosporascus cannonballus]RYP02330.1 hypothetical protein DL766_010417 [Monosporascus sp. MC13-8B]
MPPQDKIKAFLGKAFKGAGTSTARKKEKKKDEKESASQKAQEETSAVAAAAATIIANTTATTTTTPSVSPAASASACASLQTSAPDLTSATATTSAPVASVSASVSTSAAAVSAASVPAPAPAPIHPPAPQQPSPGSVRCCRCSCLYFPAANNSLACYHHPGMVFFRHASSLGYIPSLDLVDHPYAPSAFVWTCCGTVVGRSSGCVYQRHVPAGWGAGVGGAGRGSVSPRMDFRGENPGAF